MTKPKNRTVTVIHGLSKGQIRDMLEWEFGACVWAIEDGGDLTCYPSDDVSVRVSVRPRELRDD